MPCSTPSGEPPQVTIANAQQLFDFLEPRRRGSVQVMSQVPGLSIAAQALLFTVALNERNPAWGRITVLIAGLAGVLAAMHLLAKHRYFEELHSDVLQRCLECLGAPGLSQDDLARLLAPGDRSLRWRSGWRAKLVSNHSTFKVWIAALCTFALADLVLLGFTVLQS